MNAYPSILDIFLVKEKYPAYTINLCHQGKVQKVRVSELMGSLLIWQWRANHCEPNELWSMVNCFYRSFPDVVCK